MVETDFMKLYEKLNNINENWYSTDRDFKRVWVSDSAIEFKNFMRNLSSTGIKGVRLCVAPDLYMVAKADDFNHYDIVNIAEEEFGIKVPANIEQTSCGIPKCYDFESGNFEIARLKQAASEEHADTSLAKYLAYDPTADYIGVAIADYGTFELSLRTFRTRDYPDYVPTYYPDAPYFEDSETYRVLKPLLKRIYIYGQE
jgi:hypothetical protein